MTYQPLCLRVRPGQLGFPSLRLSLLLVDSVPSGIQKNGSNYPSDKIAPVIKVSAARVLLQSIKTPWICLGSEGVFRKIFRLTPVLPSSPRNTRELPAQPFSSPVLQFDAPRPSSEIRVRFPRSHKHCTPLIEFYQKAIQLFQST